MGYFIGLFIIGAGSFIGLFIIGAGSFYWVVYNRCWVILLGCL